MTVVSRWPQSTTRPVTAPIDINDNIELDAKLNEGTCESSQRVHRRRERHVTPVDSRTGLEQSFP